VNSSSARRTIVVDRTRIIGPLLVVKPQPTGGRLGQELMVDVSPNPTGGEIIRNLHVFLH
jgi:hypothetical protein